MAFNGSGTFVRVHDWTTDLANTVPVTASRMDDEMDGMATGLSTALCKDGQQTATARIPFAVGVSSMSGSSSAVSYAHIGDLNTGIFFPNADNTSIATAGTERVRVDDNGSVAVHATSGTIGTPVFVVGGANPQLVSHNQGFRWNFLANGNDIGTPTYLSSYSRHATPGSHTIVQDDDEILHIVAYASDGTDFAAAAQIIVAIDGTPGSDDMPGRWEFRTSPDGSQTPATALLLDSGKNVVCNNAAIATNATNGFFYAPSCAGTPTGTPTTYTGRVPIVIDSSNNRLYFFSGGAWRNAGP